MDKYIPPMNKIKTSGEGISIEVRYLILKIEE